MYRYDLDNVDNYNHYQNRYHHDHDHYLKIFNKKLLTTKFAGTKVKKYRIYQCIGKIS